MTSYILKDTKSGEKTLIYTTNGRESRLHSAYDPLKEANRAVENFEIGRSSIIIVSGLALAFHLSELLKKYPKNTIIAVEKDRDVIQICKKTYPEHIENIPVVNSINDLPAIFESISMEDFKGISHYTHRPSYQLNRKFYDDIANNIKQYISSKISDLLTRFEFEERWIENIFENLPHLFTSSTINSLFGRFEGMPGIIVSAGPSLKKNIHLLKDIRESALIISVDTAIPVFDRKNIDPHITMTLDAQSHSIKHFLGLKSSKSILAADIVSYPPILKTYKGQTIISTTSKYYTDYKGNNCREATPAMDWVEQYIDPPGDVQSGGSVATSVFDMLLNFGCNPIILLGQDLAYTGREIHCTGTHHNKGWLPICNRFKNLETINQAVIRKRSIKYVDAFGGKDQVISDFVFDLYKGWFEDSAQKVNRDVINSTEGGARIKNTVEKKLNDTFKNIKKPVSSPDDIINRSISQKSENQSPERLLSAIKKAIEDTKKIKVTAESIIKNQELKRDILEEIEKTGLMKLYNPFLRKTRMYIARKNLSQEEAISALSREVKESSQKLNKILIKAKISLEKI